MCCLVDQYKCKNLVYVFFSSHGLLYLPGDTYSKKRFLAHELWLAFL